MPRSGSHKAAKNKPPKRPDVAAAQRALQALELRLQGKTYEQIANACGYRSKSGAYDAVQRELERTLHEPAEHIRTLEVRRLDRLYDAMEQKALNGSDGSTWYVDRCLKIMERRASLLGLDVKNDGAGAGLALVSVPIAADVLEAI